MKISAFYYSQFIFIVVIVAKFFKMSLEKVNMETFEESVLKSILKSFAKTA